jgi:hypothetical protein
MGLGVMIFADFSASITAARVEISQTDVLYAISRVAPCMAILRGQKGTKWSRTAVTLLYAPFQNLLDHQFGLAIWIQWVGSIFSFDGDPLRVSKKRRRR